LQVDWYSIWDYCLYF